MDPLRQTVSNWYPRFLADGCTWADVEQILAEVREWSEWAPAWRRMGDRYAALAAEAEQAGYRAAAASYRTRAAAYYHFAQFMLFDDLQLRAAIHAQSVQCMVRALPDLEPPGRHVQIPFEQIELAGYLRLPRGQGPHPVVVMLPGLDSSKEELYTFEQEFQRLGIGTLSLDGPGQGETWYRMAWRPDYEKAVSAAVDWLLTQPGVDGTRLAVFGRSFGGYLAPRCAALEPRFKAAIGLAGPYDLSYWDELQPLIQQDFRHYCKVQTLDEAAAIARGHVSLQGLLGGMRARLLIVHGDRDEIIPVRDAHRIVAEARDATLKLYPGGNHVCENYAAEYRPFVADWLRAALQ